MSVDAEHVIVAGPSGGGKTTYLREQHARHDGPSIFLTTKGYERTAADNPPRRIRKSSADYPSDIETARDWARQYDGEVQVITDEVQNAPTFHGDNGPVRKMLHEDRSARVKAVIATQNPQDLHSREWNYGPLQQCKWVVWVGPAKTWHRGFREWLNLEPAQLPSENYTYHVIEPSDPPEVVYKGTTDPRFG
jgi:hypothetical protein